MRSCFALPTILLVLFVMTPQASACSCVWFFDDKDHSARFEEITRKAPIIVWGTVTEVPRCEPNPSAEGEYPNYRTLKVHRVLKNSAGHDAVVEGGNTDVLTGPVYDRKTCTGMINSCQMFPQAGMAGIWGLAQNDDGNITFLDVCQNDAIRRHIAKEMDLPLSAVGGETDAVLRRYGPDFIPDLVDELLKDESPDTAD